jgi:hypothetical protein
MAKLDSSLVTPEQTYPGNITTSAFPSATNGISTASGFLYSEVGTISVGANAVYDDTFAAVDSVKGECRSGFDGNALSNGQYTCQFGSAPAVSVGRFVPDHFTVTGTVSNACAISGSTGGFTYMDKSFILSPVAPSTGVVEARNVSGGKTSNYSTALGFAPGAVNFGAENADNGTDLSGRLTTSATGCWSNGAYMNKDGSGNCTQGSFSVTFARPTATTADVTWGAFDSLAIGATVVDSDVTTVPRVSDADMNPSAVGGTSLSYKTFSGSPIKMRFGRLILPNVYGSDLRSLTVPVQVQYWTGNGWKQNSSDSCSILGLTNFSSTGADIGSVTSTGAGKWDVVLKKPSGPVKATLCADIGSDPGGTGTVCSATTPASMSYLQWLWSAGITFDDPVAQATFGVYKGNSNFIYMRESY